MSLLYTSGVPLPLAVRFVASANMLAVVVLKQFGKSFTYRRNNIGPRLEPSGTPHETVRHFDVVWLTLHICFLFVKYDSITAKPLQFFIQNGMDYTMKGLFQVKKYNPN